MRLFIRTLAAAAAIAAGLSPAIETASAAPIPAGGLAGIVGDALPAEKTQFFYGGQNYCWYPGGWHGPGYYWCGYAWRRGFGWGGGYGWNGWRGGRGFHGGGFHGGGFHGGGHGGHH